MKVLIVDDEPRILLLMRGLMKSNGYDVETAPDGPAALEIVKTGSVDVVMTDLRMQPMDGMQLFREIKAVNPAIPVVLITAYASVETAIEAMKSGVFDYLTKPFKVDELVSCLKRAEEQIELEKKQALNEVKNEVSEMALSIARAVIERDIDEKDHDAFIDEFIDKMGE